MGFAFLEYLLSRLVEHLTQVTMPLRTRLRREHDCLHVGVGGHLQLDVGGVCVLSPSHFAYEEGDDGDGEGGGDHSDEEPQAEGRPARTAIAVVCRVPE